MGDGGWGTVETQHREGGWRGRDDVTGTNGMHAMTEAAAPPLSAPYFVSADPPCRPKPLFHWHRPCLPHPQYTSPHPLLFHFI